MTKLFFQPLYSLRKAGRYLGLSNMLLIAERMHVLWGLIEKESVFFFFFNWRKAFSDSGANKQLNRSSFVSCMDFMKNWQLCSSSARPINDSGCYQQSEVS